jgi:Glycolipid transfer protein (GLTP)
LKILNEALFLVASCQLQNIFVIPRLIYTIDAMRLYQRLMMLLTLNQIQWVSATRKLQPCQRASAVTFQADYTPTEVNDKDLPKKGQKQHASENRRLFKKKAQQALRVERKRHPALRFLNAPAWTEITTTRVGRLADGFAQVAPDHIDMQQLLTACHSFCQAMVEVDQALSARDLRQNIGKAQRCLGQMPAAKGRVTLPQLLAWEKAQHTHNYAADGTLTALQEQSGAMGLLWIRRSLQFQYHLFQALLRGEIEAADAATAAYQATLQPNHGWALQQVYQVALKSATPSREEWLARLGGFSGNSFGPAQEHATKRDLQHLLEIWQPLIEQWQQIYLELNLEDRRRV